MTFYELERECKARKKKVFVVIIIVIILAIISLGLFLYFYFNKSQIKQPHKIAPKSIIKIDKKAKKIEIAKKSETNKTKVVAQKSKQIETLKPIIDLDINDKKSQKIEVNKSDETKIIKPQPKPEKPKVVLKVQELPSFDTCIILAKNYYKNEDYQNALKWAKNANMQNKERKISWIIVSKSLYKLNQKQKALKVLQTYYNYTKDKEVLEVIKRIEKDEI